jgi:GAF domain
VEVNGMDTKPVNLVDVELVNPNDDAFPFRTELSFCQLIGFWAQEEATDNPVRAAMARVIREQLRAAPDLCAPIEDRAVLRAHRPLVDALMSTVFPAALWDLEVGAILVPFRLQSVYATPSFERLLMGATGILRGRLNLDAEGGLRIRVLHAYRHILQRFYGIDLDLGTPLVITVRDPETGLDRHFKTMFDSRFMTVDALGGVPPLSDEARERILANPSDPWLLAELLPPDRFVFRGLHLFKAADVTDQEILSSIKRDLIDRESIVSSAAFQKLRDKLRALFRRPALDVSFAAIDGDQVFLLSGAKLQHRCLFADSMHYSRRDFAGTLYGRAVDSGQPLYIENLATYPERGPLEEQMLAEGLRSLVIAPLHYQDMLIGCLKLYSPEPGDFSPNHAMRLAEVLPLFSMAVKRSMDELNSRVQAVIKEKCTAIHPSVEWRFRKGVLHALEATPPGESLELEPIVFDNVYPLYSASDIRGSSTQRATAIQADLATQLELALEVVRAAHRAKDLPILDELAFRIHRHIEHLQAGLKSGDELTILNFLRQHVERVFDQVASVGGDVRARIADYRAAVDPRLGFVYRQRKDFEQTITLINDTLSSYLDQEETRSQAMFSHYFEKQQTDGVEWGLYVGDSLVEHGGFDPLHLRNLRLWQLMVLAGMARRAEALKARLALPLEVTHLVLVHHAPLAVRFRLDEKRFDVDGAYNVRYEVIKKRIDKAIINGTRERLTQPGRIAIIYSQPREATEYREYIEYLQARGDLVPGVEDLELEMLQGVDGLRALRVAVNLEKQVPLDDAVPRAPDVIAGR